MQQKKKQEIKWKEKVLLRGGKEKKVRRAISNSDMKSG